MFFQDVLLKKTTGALSPVVLKILSLNQVQTLLLKVLTVRQNIKENIALKVRTLSKSLDVATRDDISQFSANFRNLEKSIRDLKDEMMNLYEKEASLRKEIENLKGAKTKKKA